MNIGAFVKPLNGGCRYGAVDVGSTGCDVVMGQTVGALAVRA